jgi:hypothetical protein
MIPYIAQKLENHFNTIVPLDIAEETYNLKSEMTKTVYHNLARKLS